MKEINLDRSLEHELKIDDMVILKPGSARGLYDAEQYYKEKYKEIHEKNIQGKVTDIFEKHDHYFWGKYATVKWNNGSNTELIHVSWLEKCKLI